MNSNTESIKQVLNDLRIKFEGQTDKIILTAAAYKSLGDTDKALSILLKEIRGDSKNTSAKIMVAEIYYERWIIDESKKYLEEVVNETPDNEKALDMLYKIYISENNKEKAHDLLNIKLLFSSNKQEVFSELQNLRSNLQPSMNIDITEKIKDKLNNNYLKTDIDDYNNEIITETMADLYINQGYYDKAIYILEKLLVEKPHDLHIKTKLSLSLASMSLRENKTDEIKETD
jgi:predicted Zn-dependent protease